MRFLRPIAASAFLVGTVSAPILWVETGGFGGLFFEPPGAQPGPPVWKLVLSGVVMIVGVYCGRVHAQLNGVKGKVDIVKELSEAGKRPELWRGLVASPILFAAVYSFLEQQPGFVLGLLFAFENGFFCDKMLEDGRAA